MWPALRLPGDLVHRSRRRGVNLGAALLLSRHRGSHFIADATLTSIRPTALAS
jgi:hypothetical protein